MKNKDTFWITNFSNTNISLSDLALTVRAMSTVNLLDRKHYSYTREQLEKSAESGSLFKKKNKISVRKVAPDAIDTNKILFNRDNPLASRERSVLSIKEAHYEELHVSDDQYAAENAELADMDSQPLIKKE